ncbi:MAG TPA: hypothetical protein VH723_02920 [Candidatus Limnocylindrales bacterium]
MSDFPIPQDGRLAEQFARVVDVERKIPRALEELGPVSGRDVVLIGTVDGIPAQQLTALGARLRVVPTIHGDRRRLRAASADAIVAWWSGFRGVDPSELVATDRVLRPGGRLLVVHDYGRDDVSGLRGDLPEYGSWSRRDGPFLSAGFRIRVLHCWWTFDSLEAMGAFLETGFGQAGRSLAATLRRPRLSYNVAVYHRTKGAADALERADASAEPAEREATAVGAGT